MVCQRQNEKTVRSDNSLSFRSQYPKLRRITGESEQTNFVSVQCFGIASNTMKLKKVPMIMNLMKAVAVVTVTKIFSKNVDKLP